MGPCMQRCGVAARRKGPGAWQRPPNAGPPSPTPGWTPLTPELTWTPVMLTQPIQAFFVYVSLADLWGFFALVTQRAARGLFLPDHEMACVGRTRSWHSPALSPCCPHCLPHCRVPVPAQLGAVLICLCGKTLLTGTRLTLCLTLLPLQWCLLSYSRSWCPWSL